MGSRSRTRSETANTTNQITTNEQQLLENIDGIGISGGSGAITLNQLDGGALRSNTEIAHDALNTSRSGFTFALNAIDQISGTFGDAFDTQSAANSDQLETVVRSTRSDASEAFTQITEVATIGAVAAAAFGLYLVLKK